MIYRKFSPCDKLASFVECYFIWESVEKLKEEFVVESPPSGFGSIVINSGDSYFLQNRKYHRLSVPKQFIAGQSIYSYKLFLSGNISIAGIVFKPAALNTLFNLPAYEYLEERVDLKHIFNEECIDGLVREIQAAEDCNQKVRVLENFILGECDRRKPVPDFIDHAANLIVEKNGLLHVTELMQNIFMSRRNFERKFYKKVGLSPKFYARIRRISYLMNLIAGKKKVDWIRVLYECEFFDQSHFIKDFVEFTGRTPQQYLFENVELANHLEKPIQESIS